MDPPPACVSGRSVNGEFCPYDENEPQTADGILVWDVLRSGAVFKRAGLAGVVIGIDMAEALTRLPACVDIETAKYLIVRAEVPAVNAVLEKDDTDGADAGDQARG